MTLIKKRLVVIDDSLIIRQTWKLKNEDDFEVCLLESPESFFEKFVSESDFANIFIIICDFHFDNSSQTGKDVIVYIKSLSPSTKVYLSSFEMSDLEGIPADGTLDKEAFRLKSGL